MRITFVLPYAGTSGGTRVVAIYADRLTRRGHDVLVVSTPRRPAPLRAKIRSLLKGNGWPKPYGPSHLDAFPDVRRHVLDAWRPLKDSDVPDADVIIATWWETAEWIANLSPRKGAKVFFLQHDESQFPGQPEARVIATWKLPMRKITIARWLLDLARQRGGDAQVSLVPNSVDTKQFRAAPRGKQPSPTVGMMYSQVAYKGTDVALKAFDLAAQRVPGLKLIAFGAEPLADHLPLPAGATYHREPPQATLPQLYASCDAWLFASRSEGFGLPILEAMACHTPVIATPAGAAPELVSRGGGILLRSVDDVQGMADAIVAVAQMDEASWREMSANSYRTATSYSWDQATDLFESALESACGIEVAQPVETSEVHIPH